MDIEIEEPQFEEIQNLEKLEANPENFGYITVMYQLLQTALQENKSFTEKDLKEIIEVEYKNRGYDMEDKETLYHIATAISIVKAINNLYVRMYNQQKQVLLGWQRESNNTHTEALKKIGEEIVANVSKNLKEGLEGIKEGLGSVDFKDREPLEPLNTWQKLLSCVKQRTFQVQAAISLCLLLIILFNVEYNTSEKLLTESIKNVLKKQIVESQEVKNNNGEQRTFFRIKNVKKLGEGQKLSPNNIFYNEKMSEVILIVK